MAISSPEDICNLALLGHLGQDPITAIGENSRQGELTQIFYDTTRDALLRSHPWNFAIARSPKLAADGVFVVPPEYQYAFALPTDCLKVIRTSIEADGCDHDYRVEGRFVLSNETNFSIEYVKRATEVGQYDALFVNLLAMDLAILMCMPLADNSNLKADLIQQRREMSSGAMTIDAQEGKPRETVDSTGWLYSRF